MKKYPILDLVLSEFDLVLLDHYDFGLDDCLKKKTCTRDCVMMAQKRGLSLCDRSSTKVLFDVLNGMFSSPLAMSLGSKLPENITIVEDLCKGYYVDSTIYFKRKFLFFVEVKMTHDDVFGSYIFDRKLIFKQP